MNKTMLLMGEFLLILIYLGLILFVLDLSDGLGLVILGVVTVIIFGLVILMERKREKIKEMEQTVASSPTVSVEGQPQAPPPLPPKQPPY